ncbi:hypothetical protein [Amycolatopsis sp. NPDC059657]|uniref:hypothetical protein n=1 Tax=Amycolatopsis sp. NPDC059657 TaxID=3346899 RepID=UPI0036712B22
MNDIELPPRRELPPELRARLRSDLRRGMFKEKRTRAKPLAAVAAAVLLFGGVAVGVHALRDEPGELISPAIPPGLHLDKPLAERTLDRCWNALRAEKKTGSYPKRSLWVPVFTKTDMGITVVAARANGKPLFCEASSTSVTLSDPNALLTMPGVALHADGYVVAGVADPEWGKVRLSVLPKAMPEPERSASVGETELGDGLFVILSPARLDERVVALLGKADGGLAPSPVSLTPPMITLDDKPAPGDRTVADAKFLGDCLRDAGVDTPGAETFEPGAKVTLEVPTAAAPPSITLNLMVGRNDRWFLACTTLRGGPMRNKPVEIADRPVTARFLGPSSTSESSKPAEFVGGVVPRAAAGVSVTVPGFPAVPAVVANGTFAAVLTKEMQAVAQIGSMTFKVTDAAGAVLHDGPAF